MGFGVTPKSDDGVPLSCVYIPGTGLIAISGVDVTTDGALNKSALVQINTSAVKGFIAPVNGQLFATAANTDFSWTFSQQVNHVLIQNNTNTNVHYDLDATATAGSPILYGGVQLVFDIQCLVVHLYVGSIQNVNGNSAGNFVVRGWL